MPQASCHVLSRAVACCHVLTVTSLRPALYLLKAEDAQTPSDSNLSSAGTETGMHRYSVLPPRPPIGDDD
jgi:hypothetical protein